MMRTTRSLPCGGGEGGPLSGRSLPRRVSVQVGGGFSVQVGGGSLSKGGLCSMGSLCSGGSLSGGSPPRGFLSRGISVQGGLCPR